jgi:hypothetical protein
MNDLLEFTIDAHGGLENWKKFNHVSAHLQVGGITWAAKQVPGIMDEINVISSMIKQHVSFFPFIKEGWHNTFETNKVVILDEQDTIVDQLFFPRNSFNGYAMETPWSKLQLTYFTGYAMWTYLNVPFCFVEPGYAVKEIEPWTEDGQLLRRLQVTFPDQIATHSREQVFYIDKTGLFKRHDYNVEILNNAASVHYITDYTEVQGVKFPTNRNVYKRNEDNTALVPAPVFVTIRLSNIKLS